MPTSRPSAQVAVSGRPAKMIPARMRSTMPLGNVPGFWWSLISGVVGIAAGIASWPSRDGAVAHATESEVSTSTRKFKIIGHAKAAAYTRRAFV